LPKYQRKTPLPDKSKGEVSIGRPTVVNDTVIPKLVDAFSLGCTDEEACLYADIGMSTLYKYQEANPEFVERKKLLKQKPFLKARNTVIKHLDDPDHAEWYLERKGKNEFGMKTAVEYSRRRRRRDYERGDNQERIPCFASGRGEPPLCPKLVSLLTR
jgi:hypothetical protein